MCGRFSMAIDSDDLQTALSLGSMPENWHKRYNIAPTQNVAVVRDPDSRDVSWMRWGLVPHWAKDPSIGSRMINARAETVYEKPSFRGPFRSQRCLILADGFYEWKKPGGNEKGSQPFYFSAGGKPFAFAGLWDHWTPKDAPEEAALETCTIITCPANALVAKVHDRMPVILSGEDAWEWLSDNNETALIALLQPAQDGLLQDWPVSKAVNSPSNDSPDLIEAQAEN